MPALPPNSAPIPPKHLKPVPEREIAISLREIEINQFQFRDDGSSYWLRDVLICETHRLATQPFAPVHYGGGYGHAVREAREKTKLLLKQSNRPHKALWPEKSG